MKFITALDYEHLDNGMFLTAFARALSQKKERGIILHGDSEYTNRIIQTGVMREDATIRATKELSRRLVALLADEGVPVIALNGYQKSLVTITNDRITIDKSQIENLPGETIILISNLVTYQERSFQSLSLSDLSEAFLTTFQIEELTLFSIKDGADIMSAEYPKIVGLSDSYNEGVKQQIPKEFRSADYRIRLTTPSVF